MLEMFLIGVCAKNKNKQTSLKIPGLEHILLKSYFHMEVINTKMESKT